MAIENDKAAAPRRRRKEARPGEIIEAGLAEFAARGFAAAKLDDVARRAGIAKGTIYRYFPSKEALFEAAVLSLEAPLAGEVERMIDAFPGPAADLLRLVIGEMYARLFQPELQTLMQIIISEGGRHPAIAAFYHRQMIAMGQRLLGRIVARGIASGEFRDGAVAKMPMIVIAPAMMATIWKMTFDTFEPLDMKNFAAAHLELVLDGLRVRE